MKGVYIYFDSHFYGKEISSNSVGILKKIFAQLEFFKNRFGSCEIVNLYRIAKKNYFTLFFSYLFSKKSFDLSGFKNKKYDYVYIRALNPTCRAVIELLKLLRKNNSDCKIIYEIPTYPYDLEHKSIRQRAVLFIDKFWRKKLHLYVDRIATLTDDKIIFGCKTIKITNGTDINSIPICKKNIFDEKNINLIAVAQFAFWHGYERVIEGLHKYGKENVALHLVGFGSELEKYKNLVKKYDLEDQVIFYGALSGDALTAVFDQTDIALCSLACHKKNIYMVSELKSREYLCRGLPIVTSTKIDIVPDDFKYALHVPEDDSAIDIQEIIDFAKKVYENGRAKVTAEIRGFAEKYCGMNFSMKNVAEYLKK